MRFILALATLGFGFAGVADAKEPSAPRPLSMEAIDQVIPESDRAVQACGRGTSNKKDPRAVFIHLEIDADGYVREAQPRRGKGESSGACLAKVAKRMRFPRTGTTSRLDFPFVLMPR